MAVTLSWSTGVTGADTQNKSPKTIFRCDPHVGGCFLAKEPWIHQKRDGTRITIKSSSDSPEKVKRNICLEVLRKNDTTEYLLHVFIQTADLTWLFTPNCTPSTKWPPRRTPAP